MSFDWLALGSALAALPIVLLLCFTGCVLDRHGTAPDNPLFTFPPGLNLHAVSISVTMTIVGVDDTPPPETQSLSAVDIPSNGETLTFSTIDASKVNTSPPFGGGGVIGPFLTLTCDCTIVLEGNPTNKQVPLSMSHDADDADSLGLTFTLSVTGGGTDPADYSLA